MVPRISPSEESAHLSHVPSIQQVFVSKEGEPLGCRLRSLRRPSLLRLEFSDCVGGGGTSLVHVDGQLQLQLPPVAPSFGFSALFGANRWILVRDAPASKFAIKNTYSHRVTARFFFLKPSFMSATKLIIQPLVIKAYTKLSGIKLGSPWSTKRNFWATLPPCPRCPSSIVALFGNHLRLSACRLVYPACSGKKVLPMDWQWTKTKWELTETPISLRRTTIVQIFPHTHPYHESQID